MIHATKSRRVVHTSSCMQITFQEIYHVESSKTGTPSNLLLDHEEYGETPGDLKGWVAA